MKRFLAPLLGIIGLVMLCAGNPIGLILFLAGALMVNPKCAPGALFTFPAQFAGRYIDVSPSTGSTLSRAVIKPWTPQMLEDNALIEIGYDKEYGRLVEARIAGYRENTLSELTNSRVTNVKRLVQPRPTQGNKSIVFPWIQMMQKHNVNIQYWKVNSGQANPGAGANGLHPGAWDLVVANQAGAFATALPNIHHYFLPGRALFVDYASTDNVVHNLQYTIVSAVPIGAGATATVTVVPNIGPNGWSGLLAAEKLPFQIGGLAGGNAEAGTGCYLGANSVSDYESYKHMDVAVNNLSVLHYPIQTSRILWEYTDDWVKIMANTYNGTFFTRYWQMDEAEQRRQHQFIFEQANLQSAFFGQAEFTDLQDPLNETKWRQLPTARDPANTNNIMEYKTRAEGIKTQLVAQGRYIDKAGGNILLSDLFARHYLLCRAKEAEGGEVDTSDWMTDHESAGLFEQMMLAFYPAYYNNSVHVYIQAGDVLNPDMNTVMAFKRYPVPIKFGGGYICVYHHKFFADRMRAFGGVNAHRNFMSIDWSDYMFGVIATNSRTTKTNELDEIYRYVLKVNNKHCMHQSITWTSILQDPNRHLAYQNFAAFTDDIAGGP